MAIQDPFLTVTSSREIEFQGNIEEIILREEFKEIPVEVVNLDESLYWVNTQLSFDLVLEGPKIFMEVLDIEDLKMIVDMSDAMVPGEHIMNVVPTVPPGIIIRDFEPDQVTVILISMEEE